ncbi:MAG TPA: rRNA maturation RNase YbeY [Xanthobacteraceae bacterium]|nr:rRNA maturation RNase YbeY [Xanthobacteraceae bacterium]
MPSAARRTRPAPAIDIVVESPVWREEPGAAGVIRRAIGEAARATGAADTSELAVMLCDDATMGELNGRWRGRPEPTNVLSFPAAGRGPAGAGTLGDIAIAYETTAREAEAEAKPFADHLAHLAVHGFLHLLGYDHQSDAKAAAMERLETAILARLGVPDPYAKDGTSAANPKFAPRLPRVRLRTSDSKRH